jgi:hypothetical protein
MMDNLMTTLFHKIKNLSPISKMIKSHLNSDKNIQLADSQSIYAKKPNKNTFHHLHLPTLHSLVKEPPLANRKPTRNQMQNSQRRK